MNVKKIIAGHAIAMLFMVLMPLTVFASVGKVAMPYGGSNRIVYDLNTGTYGVYHNGVLEYWNVSFNIKLNGKTFSPKDYTSITYKKTAFKDGFGSGEKYVITLTGKDLANIEQVFYTYAGREYFLTEVQAIGKGLHTNSIVPFSGNIPQVRGDARSVFVPFDNDTFIRYNAKAFVAPFSGTSAEVGAVYDNDSRNGFVAGSVEHEVWKTGISSAAKPDSNTITVWSGYTEESITRDNIAHGEISGDTVSSPKIFIGYFTDWRTGLEEYGKANRIAEPPYVFNWTKPTPVGWNSWGVMQEKLTAEKIFKVADFFADSIPAFRTGNTAYIDLDSYWDNLVHNGDYSELKKWADYCKSKGLQPGIYWAPFADWGFKDGPNRKVEGSNYTYGDIWTKVGSSYHDIDGARALDPTHPATQKRVALVIGKLKACGFKMIKIDFLGHATAESTHFYDPTVKTGMQAYRKGMEYLIDQLGGQMLVYAAISPNLAAGRYVHMRRIACDAFKSINDTQYTLNSLTYGWWQTYVYNYLDADQLVMANEKAGVSRARILSGIITGTVIAGDDFSVNGPWSKVAKTMYQNPELLELIKNGKSFKPVEGNTGDHAAELFIRQIGNVFYLAVFNYGKDAKTYPLDPERLGLSSHQKYRVTELLRGAKADEVISLDGEDAALYKFQAAP